MFFLVDNNNKVIFGWSAKCGCSHVKRLFWFLKNNAEDKQIHTSADMNKLPSNIEKYTTIIKKTENLDVFGNMIILHFQSL
jgi:hypothetical protein